MRFQLTGETTRTDRQSSDLAQKAAGTFVEAAPTPESSLLVLLQEDVVSGKYANALSEFCKTLPERPNPRKLCVESVSDKEIVCRIPCRVSDHESLSTFATEVRIRFDTKSRVFSRVD